MIELLGILVAAGMRKCELLDLLDKGVKLAPELLDMFAEFGKVGIFAGMMGQLVDNMPGFAFVFVSDNQFESGKIRLMDIPAAMLSVG